MASRIPGGDNVSKKKEKVDEQQGMLTPERESRLFVMALAHHTDKTKPALPEAEIEKLLVWAEGVVVSHEMLMSVLAGLCVPRVRTDGQIEVTMLSKVLEPKAMRAFLKLFFEIEDPRGEDYAPYTAIVKAMAKPPEGEHDD